MKITKDHIRIIYGYLPDLKKLKVSECNDLDNTSHQHLYKQVEKTKLEKLDYSRN